MMASRIGHYIVMIEILNVARVRVSGFTRSPRDRLSLIALVCVNSHSIVSLNQCVHVYKRMYAGGGVRDFKLEIKFSFC